MAEADNWTTVTESKFPWEREALDFVRSQFPDFAPYRAWSNFEFIADDGSVNEVDLLVFSPMGFFLVEIKSRPGRLRGDAGTWTWEKEGKRATVDNPLIATNLKAKRLSSLLQKQKALKKKGRLPYLDALVFCSATELHCELTGNARARVCLRDKPATDDRPERPGIMAALINRECPGLDKHPRGTHDTPMSNAIGQALNQAGVRPSQKSRKVGDYLLKQIIGAGPKYQDWSAQHSQLENSRRRVRLYLVNNEADADERARVQRAALREFQILENLEHPGILRVFNFTEHELGPALLFEHDPLSLRLDHYLAQQKDQLSIETQIDLVRQLAEVVKYAHEKKIVHRGLSPQSVLVTRINTGHPRLKIFNWQLSYRESTTSTEVSRHFTATSHVDRLVEDAATAYLAPESLADAQAGLGEHLDVFSLGAIAYQIFSGVAPAASALELGEKLRGTSGLQISAVLNGASEWLQEMVREATSPIVPDRTSSVDDFLESLDLVENELTSPEHELLDDPTHAQIGDTLPGGFKVVRRLGRGACSVALLVENDQQDFILKVASDPEHNDRVAAEADLLAREEMRNTNIVHFVESLQLGNHVGFLMRPVYTERGKRLIETLGQRLRKDGRLHIDLLQRFGDDLLQVVNHLEEQGIPHRDIKPDNIAVGMVGRGSKLHLVLFDFSLSRTPAENIRAGTTGYLDPLLPLRDPTSPRWDLHAERYAAAVTLYELATGTLPVWGDGVTSPSHLPAGTEITIDAELFDPALREALTEFFTQAFRRNIDQRFDNAEEMLRAWRNCFAGIDEPGALSDHADESRLQDLLAEADFETHIPELGLGSRSTNALDRANILTVEDLLTVPMRRLMRLRGVGNKTRREITSAVKILRARLGKPDRDPGPLAEPETTETESIDIAALSVDLLVNRLLKVGARDGETFQRSVRLLLGLDPALDNPWPSQADLARELNVSRARPGQVVLKLQQRWEKDPALTRVRADLLEILTAQAGVMSLRELAEALIVARGSSEEDPQRTANAIAVIRAAVEVERTTADPRFLVRREKQQILIATDAELVTWARKLGTLADQLAQADPLLAPTRVLERLQEITPPDDQLVSETRLVRLAAEVSEQAALSSRQELYPRGMEAVRALKLSQGALLGQKSMTVAQIQDRVAGRYPDASPLPGRPQLNTLLEQAGFELEWVDGSDGHPGVFTSRTPHQITLTSSGTSRSRRSSLPGDPGDITPELADARQFEERLQRNLREGAFLTLLVSPREFDRALAEFTRRFPLELVDLEGLLIEALKETASQAGVNWELVLQTDALPQSGDWDKLKLLVSRALPKVEQQLQAADKTMLMIYPGLLARYDQMDLLSRLSQQVGRTNGIPGLWLLLPGENQAFIDGKPVPLIGPGQRTRIPNSWLRNIHRESGE